MRVECHMAGVSIALHFISTKGMKVVPPGGVIRVHMLMDLISSAGMPHGSWSPMRIQIF